MVKDSKESRLNKYKTRMYRIDLLRMCTRLLNDTTLRKIVGIASLSIVCCEQTQRLGVIVVSISVRK